MAKTRRERAARVVATAGHQGATVSIVPRDGYPTQAQAQWQHPESRRRQRRTIAGIMLSADGTAISREQSTILQNLATVLYTRLANNEAMPGEPGCPAWAALLTRATPRKKGQADDIGTNAITVREALTAAYGPSYSDKVNARGRISGRHIHGIKGKASGALAISTWTDHARDLRRLADVVESALGPDAPWSWSETTYIQLRDALISRVAESTRHTQAPRKLRRVHKVLQTYIRATRLVQKAVRDRGDIKPKPQALTLDRWLTDLKEAWTAAGLLLPEEEQPRYDRVEAALILLEGTSGRHDPRYGLWLTLGMEGRPVQLLRARRSHLEDTYPDTPRGVFRGPGTRLKHGLVYAPTPAHRIQIDNYLHGYLEQFESEFQKGTIDDYPLFPAGELIDGAVAPFRADVRPWGYRQFLGDAKLGTGYYAIERAAKVKNVKGRGPYGLKYAVADLAPLVAGRLGIGDAVAVNLATAHDTPGTAPQYRRKVRGQSSMLVSVGRILWEVRKDLRQAAADGLMETLFGFPVAGERIRRYRVSENGIAVQTVEGQSLWVPWRALILVSGQSVNAVTRLMSDPRQREQHEVDDDAREIRFASGVTMALQAMLNRAEIPGPKGDDDPQFRTSVW